MRKIGFALLAMLNLTVLASTGAGQTCAPLVGSSTGILTVTNSEGKSWHCRASLISPSGQVLTAGHCVVENRSDALSPLASKFKLHLNGSDYDLQVIEVSLSDYAILLAPPEEDLPLRFGWYSLELGSITKGETLYRPFANDSCQVQSSDLFRLGFDCDAPPGHSGEPVLYCGRVAGYTTGRLERSGPGNPFIGQAMPLVSSSLASQLRMVQPFVQGGAGDPVVRGSAVEVLVHASNVSPFASSPDGQIVLQLGTAGRVEVVSSDPGKLTIGSDAVVYQDSDWTPMEQHSLIVRVFPESAGLFKLQWRATMAWGDNVHWVNAPTHTNVRDAEGWLVETLEIGVVEPTDLVGTGGADKNLLGQTTALVRARVFDDSPEALFSQGYFRYGKTSHYAASTPPVPAFHGFSVMLENLECGTDYHYQAVYRRGDPYQDVQGHDRSFTTRPCDPEPPVLEKVNFERVCKESVVVKVDVISKVGAFLWVEYGPADASVAYSSSTFGFGALIDDSGLTSIRNGTSLQDLKCGTKYHFRFRALNGARAPVASNDMSFRTLPCGRLREPDYCK